MIRYAFKRLGFYAIAAWVALTVNFFLPRLMPGDPASALFARYQGKLEPEAMESLRRTTIPYLIAHYNFTPQDFAVLGWSTPLEWQNGGESPADENDILMVGPKGEIFTTLEQMAKQASVKVASMEPRTSPASDEYAETKVQVALKGVTLAQAVNYLHRIESAPQLLSVKALRIRTRADKQELLDVTFTVSSFEAI